MRIPTSVSTASPFGDQVARSGRLFLADFALGLVLFALIAGVFDVSSGHAFPAPPPAELLPVWAQASASVPAFVFTPPALPTDLPKPALLPLLAVATSALLALNMAVLRHVRSAYSRPRRRA